MNKQKLSQTGWFTILMLFLFFPVGLYLMWKNKKFNRISRVLITGFILLCLFVVSDSNTQTTTPEDSSTLVSKESQQSDENTSNNSTAQPTITETPLSNHETNDNTNDAHNDSLEFNGISYSIIEVYGGDLSGTREPNVAVDIGFGDREYWAVTNEYGQLIHVIADQIVLQNDSIEPVNSNGRYYNDEAKVPGTERKDLDEGHVIADSLGGVSNAYNITPQNSTLNRHGDQAYMEKVIRDAGGCENFVATITYPDTETQIPSKYKYEYVLKGNRVVDEFENVNPDEANNATEKQEEPSITKVPDKINSNGNEKEELSRIDTNGNGKVTIKEAKAAGYKMPIYSDHWLYQYMDDRDHDGMVGE